jgi:Ino eighty subunit 1
MSSYAPKPYPPHFLAAPDAAATYSIDNPWQANRRIALRRQDAQPLTREDIQFDLLEFIFSDSRAVFTPMINQSAGKQTFRELYMCAIKGSTKCSKVLKEKMIETPAFALELAKFSLLTNVGRINTTMACVLFPCFRVWVIHRGSSVFPEMKTTLRSYHPGIFYRQYYYILRLLNHELVPSLQKTTGNVQDAPRIKSCLKASLLPSESTSTVPNTPDEVMALRVRVSICFKDMT